MPDRLTPLDASFLHLEDAGSPMHVACVMTFAGESPELSELAERVASQLHLVPRYRQKLATVPLAQGRPLWVDDGDFDISRHVKSTAVARPGGPDELRSLAGRLFSRHPPPARPPRPPASSRPSSAGPGRCGRCPSSAPWPTSAGSRASRSSPRRITRWSTAC